MTTETTERLLTVLDAQDVRALRHADSLVFRQYEGQGAIRAIRDGRNTPTGFDAEHWVYTDCGIIDYGRECRSEDDYTPAVTPETATCFHHEGSAKFAPEIVTLMRRLGVGDTIRLVWMRDNNSDTIRKAGLHVDMLRLELSKKGDRNRRETYLVDVAITPDNTARMIRRTR